MLVDRGLISQGQIDFKRDMKKPDGTPDVAVVSLGLFLNDEQPDVSNFICHQHRPELIWIPEWQQHPNGVDAVVAATYWAEHPMDLARRYVTIYGIDRVNCTDELVEVNTGCGWIRIASSRAVDRLFGNVPMPDWRGDTRPHGIALTVSTPRMADLEGIWTETGVRYQRSPRGTLLVSPEQCGNVVMEFVPPCSTT